MQTASPPSTQPDPVDGESAGSPRAETGDLQPGACLSDPAELDSAVACDTVHSAEVIATAGECSDAAAAEYMGGSSGTDVLSRIVQTEVVDGACVLSLEGRSAAAPIQSSLGTDPGHGLRECLDAQIERFVPCAENHTGEVVARIPAESSESLDCDAAASDYMARDISELFSELTVEEVSSDAARRCVVSVRSDGAWLRTPLRELGNGAIETERI